MPLEKSKFILLLFIVQLVASCTIHPPVQEQPKTSLQEMRTELDRIFNDSNFADANWGVAIQSLDNGENFYLRNANKRFLPASNMKLFTTAAALVKLGPDFKYHTYLRTNGTVNNAGILEGDLILVGAGDPTFGSRYFNPTSTALFEAWADSLINQGITEIHGNIIGDDNLFDDEIMGAGWSWDDESDYYSAQVGGICYFENCVNLLFASENTTNPHPAVRVDPNTNYINIVENNITLIDSGYGNHVVLKRNRNANDVKIFGELEKRKKEYQDWVTVENPTRYAVQVLKDVLEKKNIIIKGQAVDIDEMENLSDNNTTLVASYESPPLAEIITVVNKKSQNLYAEQLLRTLGAKYKGKGNIDTGREVLKDFLVQAGIDPNGLRIADGSGLSRYNLVTPKQIITLLRYMIINPFASYYYESLPIAGRDGTLANLMKGTKAADNVRAKTGTLGNVRCLSGILKTSDGENLAFSMMANNYSVPTSFIINTQALVCERLANFKRNRQ